MPPLPESMHYPQSGWWWLHLFAAVSIFCWGWFIGQNRAERKFIELQRKRDQDQGR